MVSFLLLLSSLSAAITLAPDLTTANLGQAYNFQLAASGGTSPYTYTVTSGTLPAGLTMSPSGAITGIPQAAGLYNFSVQTSDATNANVVSNLSLRVTSASGLGISTTALTPGRVGTAYDATLGATGGTGPYAWDLVLGGGSLAPGLSFTSAGRITGTPTNAGSYPAVFRVTDANGNSYQTALTLRVDAPSLMISTSSLAGAQANVPYNQTVSASGGTAPYTYQILSGNLPPGLSISPQGVISGSPTSAGTYNFFVRATDASSNTAQASFAIVVSQSSPRIVISSLPVGILNQNYTGALVAQGGTAPYSFSVVTGSLPGGISLSSTGSLTGTPSASGTFPVTIRLTDAAGQTAQSEVLFIVNSSNFRISTSSLPNAVVSAPLNSPLEVANGTGPYTFSVLSGSLPPGVTLSSNGTLSGSPTLAGTYTFVVRATDATSALAQAQYSLQVQPSTLSISQAGLANGQVGQSYSSTLTASSGAAPYNFSLASGSLPPGLTLAANGNVSGTPTAGGLYYATVRVIDANQATTQVTVPIFVSSAGLNISNLVLPAARQNQPYTATLQAAGGTAPYTFQLAQGASLPSGLTLSPSGQLSGTPTQTTTAPFTIVLTDNAGATYQVTYNLLVNSSAITLGTTPAPAGQTSQAYNFNYAATGGTGTLTYSIESGSLPPGLTLNPNGSISGTPTAAGTYVFQLRASDANSQTASFAQAITITSSQLGFVAANLPNLTLGSPYSATYTGVGGTAPYTFTLVSGNLPPGLTLASNGTVSGTPTTAGTYSAVIRITDAAGATATTTSTFNFNTTGSGLSITTAALPSARRGQPYTAEVIAAGGRAPYFFILGTGSSLPAGLSLSDTGVISGTPTADGTTNLVIRVQDALGVVVQKNLALTVTSSTLDITNTTIANGIVGTPYTATLTAAGGSPVYTFTLSSGSLPAGLTLSGSGVLSGTPTTPGIYPVAIRLVDANGVEIQKAYTIQVGTSGLSISNASIPVGFTGQNYRTNLQASGGTAPYTFTLQPGSTLPAGLTLDGTGLLSGVPTASGQSTVGFRVVDATGASALSTLSLNIVQSTIGFGFQELPIATVGQAYTFSPTGSGGTGPYVLTAVSGLPAGLSLSPSGAFTGTPTQQGTYYVVLRARDVSGSIVESTFPLTVVLPGFRISNSTLQNGTLNQAYSQTFTTTGGTGSVSFVVQSGNLPPGLSLSNGGVLSGTPTTAGNYSFVVRATDSAGGSTVSNFNLVIGSATVNFSTVSLPSGTVSSTYTQAIGVTGGTGPYSFTLASGTLPPGLTLSATGSITGTPTTAGTYPFTVRATDALGQSSTSEFLIGIGAPGAPNILAVLSSANYVGNGVAPGEIVVIYGSNLGPTTLLPFTVTNNIVPTILGSTRVLFDGIPAPMIYTSSTQVAAVAPFSLTGKTSTRIVVEYSGAPAATIQIPVRAYKPALFTLDASGTGPGAILNQNNTVNSPTNSAARGSVISLYATGLGQTNPASTDGTVIGTPANLLAPVTATVNGQSAVVEYAGNAPGLIPGVGQINVRLPGTVITGANTVQITVGGIASAANVTVFVQ